MGTCCASRKEQQLNAQLSAILVSLNNHHMMAMTRLDAYHAEMSDRDVRVEQLQHWVETVREATSELIDKGQRGEQKDVEHLD